MWAWHQRKCAFNDLHCRVAAHKLNSSTAHPNANVSMSFEKSWKNRADKKREPEYVAGIQTHLGSFIFLEWLTERNCELKSSRPPLQSHFVHSHWADEAREDV